MNTEFAPIRIEPAYRKVAAALTGRITDRSLAAGEYLPPETELARQFGVNRSTVREALRELESGGLLARRRGSKRMVVTMPESRHIAGGVSRALLLHGVTFEDLWEALAVLEPPLAAAAARRRTRGDLGNLHAAIGAFARASRLTEDAVHNCAGFFRRLGECTHNPALVLAQEPLLQLLEPSLGAMVDLVPQARARIAAAQQRIGAAVEARDTNDAASWMSKHIRDFKKGYEVARISPQMRVA